MVTNALGPVPSTVDRMLCERVWLEGRLEEHLDAVYNGLGDGSVLLRQLGESRSRIRSSRSRGRSDARAGQPDAAAGRPRPGVCC